MKTERGVSNMWSVCSRRAESNNLTQMTDSAVSPQRGKPADSRLSQVHACIQTVFLQGNTTIPASKDF